MEMFFVALEEMFLELTSTLRLQEERLSDINNALIVYLDIFNGKNPKRRAAKLSETSEQNIQNNTLKKMEEFGYIKKITRGEYQVIDTVLGHYMNESVNREQFENTYKEKVIANLV